MPHPLVPHRANAALRFARIGYAAERGRDHVAVLEGAREFAALNRIVAQPMQQLRESPLRGIHAAAPANRFQSLAVGQFRDFRSLGLRAVVAPQIIVVERRHLRIHRHDRRSRRVQRDRFHVFAPYSRFLQSLTRSRSQRAHVIFMRLRREFRVLAFAMQWIFGHRGFQRALLAVHDRNANTQCPEIYASNDRHRKRCPCSLILVPMHVPAQVTNRGLNSQNSFAARAAGFDGFGFFPACAFRS